MPRSSVSTGAASGIGKATKELLEQRGERAIGVGLRHVDGGSDVVLQRGLRLVNGNE